MSADTSIAEMLRATVEHIGRHHRHWDGAFAAFAEAGLVGLRVPEAQGGAGLGLAEQAVLAEALGADLAAMIYPTMVLGLPLLLADDSRRHDDLVRAVIAGRTQLAAALTEHDGRYDPAFVETCARRHGDDWLITGQKSVVAGGDRADLLIISARLDAAPDDIALFLVPMPSDGLTRTGFATVGQGRAADIVLNDVRVPDGNRLIIPSGPLVAVQTVLNDAVLIQCAEGIAIMRDMLDETARYLGLRQQFGRALREFQALQHRFADMTIAFEVAAPLIRRALANADTSGRGPSRTASAAKLAMIEAAHSIGRGAIQLHGGIGMTEELALSRQFRRLTELEFFLGDGLYHRQRLRTLPDKDAGHRSPRETPYERSDHV